ncbi:MAG TPA: hypothetical protein VN837_05540 [Chloroflexota bacterium]|nr:hypothetical protein [Chloroflexota bacterium]
MKQARERLIIVGPDDGGEIMKDEDRRSTIGRLGAHALHATHDARETTAKGRRAFQARFEKEVDPDNVLSPEERRTRAKHAMKAHMTRLSLSRKSKPIHPR